MTEQEQKKPGWRERLSQYIAPKEEKGFVQKTIHNLGVDVLSDQKLENRIYAMFEFQTEFEESIDITDNTKYVEKLKEKTEQLHNILTLIASPYGTAGTYYYMQKKYNAWLEFYTTAMSLILYVQGELRPLDENQEDYEIEKTIRELRQIGGKEHESLVRSLHEVLHRHFWKQGFNFMNQCFRDKHVSERAAIVVQNAMGFPMNGGGETITGSGGRTSEDSMFKPSRSAVGRRMKNEI